MHAMKMILKDSNSSILRMEDNTLMPNHRTLSKINDTISLNSLKLEVLQLINLPSPLRELCNDLVEVAKRDIIDRMREIRAEL